MSKWPEVMCLSDVSIKCTIEQLKLLFVRYGIPLTSMSDNGQQFYSSEFRNFAKEYDFQHETTFPHHAQANGQVEGTVQITKNLLKNKLIHIRP